MAFHNNFSNIKEEWEIVLCRMQINVISLSCIRFARPRIETNRTNNWYNSNRNIIVVTVISHIEFNWITFLLLSHINFFFLREITAQT